MITLDNQALRQRVQRLARDLDRCDAITACQAVAYLAQLLELDSDVLRSMIREENA